MIKGKQLTVIGGDDRYVQVINHLAENRAKLTVVGFNKITFNHENIQHRLLDQIDFSMIDGIILPIGGTDESGKVSIDYAEPGESEPILTEDILRKTKQDCVIYTGTAKPFLRELVEKCNRKLIVLFERDEVAIANSVPTAEATLQIAMEQTKYTIHSANVLIVGFGRIGVTIARLFQNVGANVTVAARKQADFARIKEMRMQAVHLRDLPETIEQTTICINTVPVAVLTKKVIRNLDSEALIIDLASKPGGTDFKAAKRLGIQAIHALGLPGKVAPKTAGMILGETIATLVMDESRRDA